MSGMDTLDSPAVAAIVRLVREAGARILDCYGPECAVQWKAPGDPITAADQASHAVIAAGLAELAPDLPLISEEGVVPPYEQRARWERFWLVDPLDGTKEFISGNGEFTVNVALIEGHVPVLGCVYAPALDLLYVAGAGFGSWRTSGGGPPERIHSRDWRRGEPVRVVESRSHPSAELDAFLASLTIVDRVRKGSSLKFCAVAEGQADLYPRFGPLMEWDAAAGDCVYRYSTDGRPRRSPIRYNQPDLRIPGFVIGSDELIDFASCQQQLV
jgi:3'(2'), 5'-bisphosphate nucleotidase